MIETIPPRITANENLAREFFKVRGIISSVPPVHTQLESVVINRKAISANGYNPSVIRHNGRTLMAYRFHPMNSPHSELAIAELDDKFNVKTNQPLKLDSPNVEDGSFFVFKDELYLSFVDSKWPAAHKSVVKYGLVVDGNPWRLVDVKQPNIGKNDGSSIEKNWLFFEHEKKLMVLYSSWPDQIVFQLDGDTPVMEMPSGGVRWPWGEARGGCIVPYQDKLLRFFHSSLDTYPPPWRRRYFLGACIMANTRPFQMLKIGSGPIATGSEIDDQPELERNKIQHFKGNVVFPLGCLSEPGFLSEESCWWISCGINDSSCALLKVGSNSLKL